MAESEETLSKMTVQLRGLEGRENDSLRKMTVAMQDSIKAIRDYISGKTSDKQGLSRPQEVTVITLMQTAQQYIFSKSVAPAAQEEALVKNAETLTGQTLQRVNAFYNGKWKAYRKQVEDTKVNLFKDYKTIEPATFD
jgi:hypothetical protein